MDRFDFKIDKSASRNVDKAVIRLAPRHHAEGAASHVGHFERASGNPAELRRRRNFTSRKRTKRNATRLGYIPEEWKNEKHFAAFFHWVQFFLYFIYIFNKYHYLFRVRYK